jgi:hypothetical protein
VGSQEIARGARRASLALNVVDYLPAGPQRAQSAWLGPFRRHRCCWERLLAVNLNQSVCAKSLRVTQRGCKPNGLKADRQIVAKAKIDISAGRINQGVLRTRGSALNFSPNEASPP